MLAFCSLFMTSYFSKNYVSKIGASLTTSTHVVKPGPLFIVYQRQSGLYVLMYCISVTSLTFIHLLFTSPNTSGYISNRPDSLDESVFVKGLFLQMLGLLLLIDLL